MQKPLNSIECSDGTLCNRVPAEPPYQETAYFTDL